MPTFIDAHWPEIRKRIIARVEANSSAQVMSVINSMIQDNSIEWENGKLVSIEENLAIVRPLLENGEYEMLRDGVDIYISKNPNHRLNQNIIETNDSLQKANTSTQELNTETKKYYREANSSTKRLIWLTSIGAFIAIVSAIISIVALTSDHKQFEIETTPFIQIKDVKYIMDTSSHLIKISYNLFNYGKDQAKIISGYFGTLGGTNLDKGMSEEMLAGWPDVFEKLANITPDLVLINTYIIKENPVQGKWSFSDSLLHPRFHLTEDHFPYFIGMIKYINTTNNKYRKYYFIVKMAADSGSDFQYIYNENIDSKK